MCVITPRDLLHKSTAAAAPGQNMPIFRHSAMLTAITAIATAVLIPQSSPPKNLTCTGQASFGLHKSTQSTDWHRKKKNCVVLSLHLFCVCKLSGTRQTSTLCCANLVLWETTPFKTELKQTNKHTSKQSGKHMLVEETSPDKTGGGCQPA